MENMHVVVVQPSIYFATQVNSQGDEKRYVNFYFTTQGETIIFSFVSSA